MPGQQVPNEQQIIADPTGKVTRPWLNFFSTLQRANLGSPQPFSTLRPMPNPGDVAVVEDATTNVWGETIAGNGIYTVLAWFNGVTWSVIGK